VAQPKFLTVPTELVEHAEAARRFFADRGYRIVIEQLEVGYPVRPTMVCTRQGTTLFVEVHGRVPIERIRNWVRYCGSCAEDSQVALCIPADAPVKAAELTELQKLRVGLYVATADAVAEQLAPADLALRVSLPALSSLPVTVRRELGPVYEQFDRNQWREGFREATQVLEQRARKYLRRGIKSTRITVLDKKGAVRTLTSAEIDKMTLGALAAAFANIQTPSQGDNIVAQALAQVNPDRVGIAHFKGKKTSEKRLRTNVGRHMWSMVAALKELLKR
jgi:hypothetical protein